MKIRSIKSISLLILVLAIIISSILQANTVLAHERFMVPSHTVLSGGKNQYITVLSSISNDIFHPDRPFGDSGKGVEVGKLKPLFDMLNAKVITPSGTVDDTVQWQAFQRFSVADVALENSGTYRISLAQGEVHMLTFDNAEGEYGRIFGKNITAPEGVTNIVRRTTASRVETFVSLNEPNHQAVMPTKTGLSLSGPSHPNDLFAGEQATFQVSFNGKPIQQTAEVKLIKSGTRHRNDRDEQIITVSDKGVISFTPSSAGFYFLGLTTQVEVEQPADVDVQHYSLFVTLEVFPQ